MTEASYKRPIYQIDGVQKSYQGRCVLKVEHLEIFQAEILGLVGPSGSGKSTLLRLLNFLEAPDAGCLLFHNQASRADQALPLELRRKVTMVFQRPMLLDRSVKENVRFGLDLRGQNRSAHLVQTALDEVGLGDLANHKARTLSGGEAQRVALARAIVLRPEVLLLDEPTANLDPYNVGLIEKIAADLNRRVGTTLVLVTHNIFQARRLATRVAFLFDGKLVEAADVDKFFNHPADPRTAAFVRGEMVY